MTILEALKDIIKKQRHPLLAHTRLAHFAFPDDGDGPAFLSELILEELVPRMEEWCAEQRKQMGKVH